MNTTTRILRNFGGDSLAADVFMKKYAIIDAESGEILETSLDDMRDRLAKAIVEVEEPDKREYWEGEFRECLNYFIPAGRILYALGNPNDVTATLKNCYVVQIDNDDIGSIFETAKRQAILFSKGGGVGFDLSTLRPAGAPVNNSAKTTSGAVSFMDLYSMVTGIIGQYGRRGALMLTMDISHPDVIEFIRVKGGSDKSKVQFANISIRISDEFMKAVNEDADWEMSYTLKDGTEFKRTEKATIIWDLFVESNWRGAEPGIMFWDNIVNDEPAGVFPETRAISTNPCFVGDTIVAVADGRNGVTIKELTEKNEEFPVYSARKNGSRNQWKVEIKKAKAFKSGKKKIIMVNLSDGSSFKCTPDHLLALPDGKTYIEAGKSYNQEISKFYSFSDKNTEKSYRTINSKTCGYNKQYRMMYEHYNSKYDGTTHNIDHIDGNSTTDYIDNLELITVEEHKSKTKRCGINNPIQKLKGTEYLSLYSSRSNILGNGARYNWSEEKINKKLEEWDDENGDRLLELYKEKNSNNVYLDDSVYVESITDSFDSECVDVYDLTVEDNHNFYILTKWDDDKYLNSSGVLVHNCGELPLENGASCCLGSLDLNKFVKNSFTDKAEFDYEKFNSTVRVASRFLDNINILNTDREPLEINRKATELSNKIGLGFTGLADMFIRMNMKYGSHKSLEQLSKIGYCLYTNTIFESIELAKERGACGILQKYMPKDDEDTVSNYWDNWLNHKYFNLFKKDFPNLSPDLEKYGTRNIGFTTCAPSGSISIIARTSSGIEPIFMMGYDRTVHQAGKDGKKETYTVYHPLVEEYNNIYGEDAHLKNENFITSAEVDWKDRIHLQSIIQMHISASISSTINLPKETSMETISEIYKYAHHFKLKGVTIYRDGCREGVLNASEKDKKKWQILENYKFPTESDAKLKIIKSEGRKWLVTIPIDVETNLPNGLLVTTNSTETNILTEDVLGHLQILAKKHIKNGHLEKLMNNAHNQTNVVKIARVLGMLLRHRVPIVDIIKTIDKIEPPVYSFIFQIKKILGAYLPNDTLTGEKCGADDCDSMLIFEGGCAVCKHCGWTKCG